MIDPHHTCSWSRKKLTELGFADSRLFGGGVSLRVILHAFVDKGLVWFSTVYGTFNDDILLIAVDRATADGLEQNKHQDGGPIEKAFGSSGTFEEYQLSPSIQAGVGVVVEEDDHSVKSRDSILYEVYIHDGCYFFVKPTNPDFLRDLMHCVLQQHSFYLNTEVDWTSAIETTMNILSDSERVRLQSRPKNGHLTITRAKHEEPLIRWFLKRRPAAIVNVSSGQALLASQQEGT
jgi:hypothetical protein